MFDGIDEQPGELKNIKACRSALIADFKLLEFGSVELKHEIRDIELLD